MRAVHAWTAILVGLAAATAVAADGRGHLILNGGGPEPEVVMRTFVDLAGGADAAIVVVPTASEQRGTGRRYRKLFENEYGCRNVSVLDLEEPRDGQRPEVVETLRTASGIFFTGDDQRHIVAAFKDTLAAEALSRAFASGAVIGGTSAGTACQSALMLTGEGDFTRITADNVELWPGLGFLRHAIVDQQFVARQHQNRLMAAVLEHPDIVGIGVDEAAAIWVRPDDTFTVLGESTVMVVDAGASERWQREDPAGRRLLGARGLTVHLLLPGDGYDLRTRTVRRAETEAEAETETEADDRGR